MNLRIGFTNSIAAHDQGLGIGDQVKPDLPWGNDQGIIEFVRGQKGVQQGEIGLLRQARKSRDSSIFRMLS